MNKKEVLTYTFIILMIIFVPFILIANREFAGVDAQIADVLGNIDPNYIPWFDSLFPELSGEMETFLFSFQAAVGAGIIGYILGYLRGRRVGKNS